jgi:hypothetical protein
MPAQIAIRIAVAFVLLFVFVYPSRAAEPKLGFAVRVEGEGFFLNPLITKILVTEVSKGSLAEAAGMRAGDQILQLEGQSVAGRRAWELQPLMKLNPGETRTLRLKHTDGGGHRPGRRPQRACRKTAPQMPEESSSAWRRKLSANCTDFVEGAVAAATSFWQLAETNFYFLSGSASGGNVGAAFVIAFPRANFLSNLFSAATFRTSRAINRPHESSVMIATTATAILQPAFLLL